MKDLHPSATNDGRHAEEPQAPHAEPKYSRMDPVAPTMKQLMAARPTTPTTEEPLATGLTSMVEAVLEHPVRAR